MKQKIRILLAVQTNQHQVVTVSPRAVFVVIGRTLTVTTNTDCGGVVAKINRHAVIEHPQASFP